MRRNGKLATPSIARVSISDQIDCKAQNPTKPQIFHEDTPRINQMSLTGVTVPAILATMTSSSASHKKINRIYAHSCEDMLELKTDSVALTVTSPPYWNAIDY